MSPRGRRARAGPVGARRDGPADAGGPVDFLATDRPARRSRNCGWRRGRMTDAETAETAETEGSRRSGWPEGV
jgi:hypothetical protein